MKIALMNKIRALRGIWSGRAAFGPPVTVTINILSGACTGRCIMCRQFSPLGPAQERSQEDFPFDALCVLLDELDAMGVDSVNLCADGEPFLYRDIVPLLKHLRAGRMRYQFITNGTAITDEHIQLMDKKAALCVSMHAARADVWSAITGMSEERFPVLQETVRRACAAGVRVTYHAVITNRNINELPAILASAALYGVTEVSIGPLTVFHNSFTSLKPDRMIFERFTQSLPALEREAQRLKIITNFTAFAALSYSETGSFCVPVFGRRGRCSVGWLLTWIDSAGNVRFCCNDARPMGNTHVSSFRDIWYGSAYNAARRRAVVSGTDGLMCRECAVYTVNAVVERVLRVLGMG